MAKPDGILSILKRTFKEFSEDKAPRLAAALAYYTVFSLPPLLVLIIMIVSVFVSPQEAQGSIQRATQGLVGAEGASGIQTMIANARQLDSGGPIAIVISVVALLFSATGAFVQLQQALNTAWDVAPDPEKKGLLSMVLKRLFSVGMILVIAFLLLVSLVLSSVLSALGQSLGGFLPEGISTVAVYILNFVISFGVVTLLFAAIFKILPDADIAWKDVWFGAAVTALLFEIGRLLFGLYVGRSDPGRSFGAAGSVVVILLWVYYTGIIMFIGAEFTQVWTRRKGKVIEPKKGAVVVETEVKYRRPAAESGM